MAQPKRRTWKRVLLRIPLYAAIAYALLLFTVYFFPNSLIFFPSREGNWTPPQDATDVHFTSKDGTKLHGWWRETNPRATTFIVLHGNAGNITTRKHMIDDLGDLGANVLLFDYRGFGKSEGSAFEAGANQDAEAAWDFVVNQKKVDPKRIVLFGQSLGCAFATHLALKKPCQALVMEAPFSSARDMAGAILPWVPVGWALGVDLDNVSRMPKIKVPVLVVQGDKDAVIPPLFGKRVFESATGRKSFASFPRGGHNDLWETCKFSYVLTLSKFLSDHANR